MARKKIYYPKSHIITNLYTSGKEWMLEAGEEYIGFYHKYIDGTVMTNAVYDRASSKKLQPWENVIDQPDNFLYNSLKRKLNYRSPEYSAPLPVQKDYKNGKFIRYFLRRRNYNVYADILEIDEMQFRSWKNPNGGIDDALYFAIAIDWKLTGPLNDIVIDNANVIYGVADTNARTVQLKNNTMPGLINVLTDYIEYSIHSPATSEEIKQLFG